jgi:hypothetical protein
MRKQTLTAGDSLFKRLPWIHFESPTERQLNNSTLVNSDAQYVVQRGEYKWYWYGVTFWQMLRYAFCRVIVAAMAATPAALAIGVAISYPAMGAVFMLFAMAGLLISAQLLREVCNIRRINPAW